MDVGPEFRDLFIVQKVLGSGAYGKIYAAVVKATGARVVVKRMYLVDTADIVAFRNEVSVHCDMAEDGIAPAIHDWWIHYSSLFTSDGKIRPAGANEAIAVGIIVMQRMDGTLFNLAQACFEQSNGDSAQIEAFTLALHKTIKREIFPMLDRVNNVHNITHGDCTLSNIMFVDAPYGGAPYGEAPNEADEKKYFIIDWGFAQRFCPNGNFLFRDVPMMRWHRKKIDHYDRALLEWSLNDWISLAMPRPVFRFATPCEIMRTLIQLYAKIEDNQKCVKGDSWQNYSNDHPFFRHVKNNSGENNLFKKRTICAAENPSNAMLNREKRSKNNLVDHTMNMFD